ncbi:hypothetical protein PLESTM_000177100 [Pleodorina starrii]|nr:hypothetical protein PLESTM_000177100 [Pleodorina starrii]
MLHGSVSGELVLSCRRTSRTGILCSGVSDGLTPSCRRTSRTGILHSGVSGELTPSCRRTSRTGIQYSGVSGGLTPSCRRTSRTGIQYSGVSGGLIPSCRRTSRTGIQCSEQAVAMRVKNARFQHTTADTWYYEGARYVLLDNTCAEAGAFHNNEVEACGLLTDERERPDDGSGPYWRLQYLPAALLVRPLRGHNPTSILQGVSDFASHGAAFPLCPRPNLEPATILMPAPGVGTEPKAIRRINIPVGDWHAYTDYGVQGRTFGEETWVIDLTLPPHGIKRTTLYVLLTRFKSLDHIRLLWPLYTTPAARKKVIAAFLKATHLEPDLAAELCLLSTAAVATRNRYPAEFRLAEELDAQRQTAGAAS